MPRIVPEVRSMILRHRTASGSPDARWEYDPLRKTITVVVRLGSARPIAIEFTVCASDRPTRSAHPILRLDATSWRVLPTIFIGQPEAGRLLAEGRGIAPGEDVAPKACGGEGRFACVLHGVVGVAESIILTDAPENVCLELMELSL